MKRIISSYTLVPVLIVLFALAIAPLVARPAAAGTLKTDFVAYNIACENVEFGTMWVDPEDGTIHLRDRVLRSVVISDNEYHNGTGFIYANFNSDPAAGVLTYHGTLEIHPELKDGYWAGSWSLQVVPSGASGIARLQGYGTDLSGLSIKSILTPLTPIQLAEFSYACGGNPPVSGVKSQATMINPGDK